MMEMIWLPGGLQSLLTKPGKKAKINMMKQRAVGKCSPGLLQSRQFGDAFPGSLLFYGNGGMCSGTI